MTKENYTAEMIMNVFIEETINNFRFLIDDYDFCRSKTEHWYIVEYTSSKVKLRVYDDPRCHELSIAIGLINDKNEQRYDLEVILEAIFGEGHNRDIGMAQDSIDGLKNQIKQIAEVIRDNCKLFLEGDIESYKNLELIESQMGERGMRQYRQEVRARAEKAFQSGDIVMALNLYESINEYLNESELERLREIRKQIRPSLIGRIKKYFISHREK